MDVVTKGVAVAIPLVMQRLESPTPLSEDGFRYLVFHGLYKAGVDIMRVALEYPHPSEPYKSKRAKIDAVIRDANGAPETAIEFKCIRKPGAPSADAGDLLGDFARLRDFPNVNRFVALLTDGKLWEYLNNSHKCLKWLLCESEQEIAKDKIPCGKGTINLRKRAGDWCSPVRAQVTGRWDVGNGHWLIVWRAWRVET